MADVRTPRESTERAAEKTPQNWVPSSTLPTPKQDDGYTYRWLRRSYLGMEDPSNMSKKMREGWEPVSPKDHPELAMFMDPRERTKAEMIEVGGLILARIPRERAEARRRHYANMTQQQMQSVDQQLANEQQDARMPIFNNRTSKTSRFGSGS
jgi:hypothetical protein